MEGGVTRLCLILAVYITNSACWTGRSKICCSFCWIWAGGMVLVSSMIHVFLFWNQNIYFMLLDIESMRLDLFFFYYF